MQREHGSRRRRLVGEGPALAAHTALSARAVLGILAFLLVWRLAILVFSYTADAAGEGSCGWGQPTLLKYSACWDSAFYLDIAEHGYRAVDGELSSIAFFPLYPLLTGLVDHLLPGHAALAGLVVGHLALAGASVYIYRLFQLEFDDGVAWRALWFLLIFPSAVFLTAVYAEPLLLFGLASMLFHARRSQWLRAGLFGALASGTKAVGVLAVIPLIVEAVAQGAVQRRDARSLAGIALAPLGALGYLAYLQVRFGDFRLLLDAEATYWLRGSRELVFLPAIRRLLYGDMDYALTFYPETVSSLPSFHLLIDAGLLLFGLAGIILWLKVRPTYGAFVLTFAVLFAFSGEHAESQPLRDRPLPCVPSSCSGAKPARARRDQRRVGAVAGAHDLPLRQRTLGGLAARRRLLGRRASARDASRQTSHAVPAARAQGEHASRSRPFASSSSRSGGGPVAYRPGAQLKASPPARGPAAAGCSGLATR